MLRRVIVGFVVFSAMGALGILAPRSSSAAPPTISITATPSTGLVDGQLVRIDGGGFAPYAHYEIFECAGDSVDEHRCDPRNAFELDSDGTGHVRFDFAIDARIYLGPDGTTSYDCRTAAAGCRIGVGLVLEHANSAFATLHFDPSAPLLTPVSATVRPATGLVDGQTVTVHGSHLSDREAGWVIECKTGGAPKACDLDHAIQLKPQADGTLTTDLRVHAGFRSPLGVVVNCLAANAECSVVVSWGLAFVADRVASVPLAFATTTPTTTTTTTTPATTTTTPAKTFAAGTTTTTPVRSTATALPRTGSASRGLAWLGALLVAIGCLVVVSGRRRGRFSTGAS
jgi:LPXTG-motif cell wall-anchored protein